MFGIYNIAYMTKSTSPSEPVSLLSLRRGETGWVYAVSGGDTQVARLAGLGLCEGARVEIVRGEDPLILKVCRTRIGIARGLAERILITTRNEAA